MRTGATPGKLLRSYDTTARCTTPTSPVASAALSRMPRGIRYTLVNGEMTFTEGMVLCAGATPGKLLRSHDMISQ